MIEAKYTERTTLTWNTVREYSGGTVKYFQNGKLHRENGPAIDRPDPRGVCSKDWHTVRRAEWYYNGKRHRENGPAVIWTSGFQVVQIEYWTHGKRTGIKGDRFFGCRNYPPKNLDLGALKPFTENRVDNYDFI